MASNGFCAKMEIGLMPIDRAGRLLQLIFNYGVTALI
jgi:hypothetical protein